MRWDLLYESRTRIAQAHVEEYHATAEQDDAPGPPVVAGVAVLESVAALKLDPARVVACEPDRGDGDRVVEEEQPLGSARFARERDGGFTRFQTVVPEPRKRG
jgi:hypothetical protein